MEAGRYLRAWSAAQALGPLPSWTPTSERILAGRLAMALGAPRLGFSLHLRAHRASPGDPEAHYYRARAMLSLRGPFAAWRFMRESELPSPAPIEVRADWLALSATVATGFRDFETAEKRLAEAAALCPDRPWIAVEHTAVLEEQDRLEEALARISDTLRASPLFRPGIGASARLLERLGRFEEAIALLRSADAELEAGSLAAHLAQILIDLERPQEALRALDRFATLSPLLETPGKHWLAARRSDAAYALGDLESARREAEAAANPFHTEIARRLKEPPAQRPRRVLLAVPFIQQQHLTCSPTALASLTCYWQRPVDHTALASEIAYDGTPGHRERQWARSHSWREREFRLTPEAARSLLDRGIPFTLSTQYATSAHAQAVAGYDPLRGTLLVRDPSLPRLVEMMLEPLLEQQASHGPRCLALVPADELSPIELPELPDQREYDELHELELCLLRHDRARAQVLRNALFVREPEHLLRLFMDARLSAYDDDAQALLPIYEALAARFPQSDLYALRRVDLLLQLGRRDEAIAALEPRARSFQADPVFAIRLAEVLADDARQEGAALRLVERALRIRPADAPALSVLAGLVYGQERREEAFELYRLAACADIHNEARIDRYVTTAQVLDRAAEAVAFLRERVARLGDRSSAPARSLFRGLEDLGRIDEGLEALEAALLRHPSDGDLLLFAAEAQGRYGRLARAQELLAAASGRSRESDRRRTEARLARGAGDLRASLDAWTAVAAAEPLALDAHRVRAELLLRLEGRSQAVEHVTAAAARVPSHLGLQRLLVEWLRDDPPRAEQVLRTLLQRHPTDAWSHRELSLVLAEQGRFDEALEALARGAELEPEQPATLGVRGLVLAQAGRSAEAAQCFRAAVERAVDYRAAVEGLIDASPGLEEKRKALRFVAGQLVKQRPADSFFTFQRRSHGILEPSEVLEALEAARAAHPDLWQPVSAIADQLTEDGRLAEATSALEQATSRFPLVAALWIDRAHVCGRQGDALGEVAFLEKASALAPGWTIPLHRLGEALLRHAQFADAAATLRRARAFDPVDSGLAGLLAVALRDAGELKEALEAFERTVALDPANGWAWNALRDLAGDEAAESLARRIVADRPRDADALIALVRQIAPTGLEEQLALLDQVLALEPRHTDAHDLRAVLLADAERFPEALAACAPSAYKGSPPCELAGRRAWVLDRSGRRSEAVAAMKAVLDRHPDYLWGIRILAEWTAEHGSPAEAVAAAERFVRVAPESAGAYAARGAARLRAKDDAGGCADLEHALALDPTHTEAGARLFDTLVARSRHDEAQDLLVRQQPHLTPEQIACRSVRLLAARGDRAGGLAQLTAELAAGRPPGPPLAPALHAMHQAFGPSGLVEAASGSASGLHVEAAALLVEVLIERSGAEDARRLVEALGPRPEAAASACRAWLSASSNQPGDRFAAGRLRELEPKDADALTLAARAHAEGPPAERLRLYDDVLRLDPTQLEARDLRALLLAQLGRTAEARAACQKLAGEKEVPPALRARAAWIEASAGRVQEARKMMRAVVSDHPWHRWGWERLLDWGFQHNGAAPSYLEDAKAHCEVFPGEPSAHGYVGDALRRSGRPREAEAAFRRSIELDPGYEWGRLALADMLLEEGRHQDAEAAVDVPGPTPPLLLRRIQAALARRKTELAQASFLELLAAEGADDDLRRRGRDAFVEAKMKAELRAAFDAALAQANPPDAAASLAMEWLGSAKDWRGCDALLARLEGPRPKLAALVGYVRALRTQGKTRRLVRLTKEHRTALRSDDFAWGLVGHALSLVDDRATVDWMQDWPKRKSSPWALNGLAISLRHLGRADEAVRVSRRALQLPADHITPCHRAWVGIEAALDGSLDEAESQLDGLEPPAESKAFYDALALLARAAIVMRRSGRAGYAEARRLLKESAVLAGASNRDIAPLRRRTVDRVVREHRGFAAQLWRFLGAA